MKVSKLLGCVLGLHLGVISLLLVQPGCQTSQPPTQTYSQGQTSQDRSASPGLSGGSTSSGRSIPALQEDPIMRSLVPGAARTDRDLIEATRAGEANRGGLDAAFNAGMENGDFAPEGEFGEFDDVAPIESLSSQRASDRTDRSGQSVPVAGESFETYTVKSGDNLWTIAKRNNVSLNELYAANGLDKNSVLRVGQEVQIPVEGGSATVRDVKADSYQPSSLSEETTSYTVKRGDTLSKIAIRYNTSVNAIKGANDKSSDRIRVGESLVIPVSGSGSSADSGSTRSSSSSSSSSASNATRSSDASSERSADTSGTRTHTVEAGEFPAAIARQYGMTSGELLALNGITDPRRLQVGQELKVSGSGSAANMDSQTETLVAPPENTSDRTASSGRSSNAGQSTSSRAQDPVEIQVIEADPLLEEDTAGIDSDAMFEGAVEIPVIRLEE